MNALIALRLAKHPWIAGMSSDEVRLLAEHAEEVRHPARKRIFAEGDPADRFWLIWSGRVALDLAVPGRGTVLIETLSAGDILGWSWLFPPYRWRFGAVAVSEVRAAEISATAIRAHCDADSAFCADIFRRVSVTAVDRLQATRLRLLDLYGTPRGAR